MMETEQEALQMSSDFSEPRINGYIHQVDDRMSLYTEEIDDVFRHTQAKLAGHFNSFVD